MSIIWKRFTLGVILLASLSLVLSGCGDYGSSETASGGAVAKTVSGVVSGNDGLPVAGATVTAYAIDADGTPSSAPLSVNPSSSTTDSAGFYALRIPASHSGPVMLEATIPPARLVDRLAKLVFAATDQTMRSAVPQRVLDQALVPPVMISFATNAVVEFIQQNTIAVNTPAAGFSGTGFSSDNIQKATFVMEAYFGAYFTQIPPPASEEELRNSTPAQQDLLVLTRALAQVAGDSGAPLSLAQIVTGIATTGLGDAAAQQIKQAVAAVTGALAAASTLPPEYVPSQTLDAAISNTTNAPMPPPVLTDTLAPSAPGSLSAQAAGPRMVTLSWLASVDGGAGATGVAGYLVYRADVTTPFLAIATLGSDATGYSDVTVVPNTQYSYRVVAFDGARNLSLPTESATVRTPAVANLADLAPPTTPVGVVCKGFTDSQVNLQWTQSTDVKSDGSIVPAAGYQVYRDGQMIALVTETSFIDNRVSAGTGYSYHVKAFDANANLSAPSAQLSVRTQAAAGAIPPAAPAGLALESSAYDRATLIWNASATSGVTYSVYRGAQRIASGIAATRYSDSAVMPNSTYQYRVSAVSTAGESAASNILNVTLPANPNASDSAPSVPANLVLAAPATRSSVPLIWGASTKSDGDRIVAGYDVLRAEGTSGNYLVVATVRFPGYTDNSVAPATGYSYQVRSFSTSGVRSATGIALSVTSGQAVDVSDTTPPSAPANLTATATANAVALSWGASQKQTGDRIVAGYRVYRDGVQIASVLPQLAGATTVSYIDNSVRPGVSYRYSVRAFDNPGNLSAASNEAQVSTPAQPPNTNTISGRVTVNGIGLAGVSMNITGDASGSFVTDANGYYSFTVLYGSYTVTPSAQGYVFTPVNKALIVSSLNRPTQDFSAVRTGSVSGGATMPGGSSGVVMTYPNGSVVGGTSYPAGTIIGGVSYPSGAVIGGVTYPTATVIGGVTYPTGTVIGGVSYPNGVVVGGVSYPPGTIVGGVAFPVGAVTGGVTIPGGTVVGGVTYPGGAVIGGVTYPAGTIIGGVTYPTGSLITGVNYPTGNLTGGVSYPTGVVIGGVTFPAGIVAGAASFPSGSVSGVVSYPVGSIIGGTGYPAGTVIGGVSYPPGSVIGGVTYPSGVTVIGGIAYPTGSVIGGTSYPSGVIIGGVSYPAGTIVGGVAFPVGAATAGFAWPTGVVVGGVAYPTGSVIGGTSYPSGVIIAGVTYPTGVVTGALAFPGGSITGSYDYPTSMVTGTLLFP